MVAMRAVLLLLAAAVSADIAAAQEDYCNIETCTYKPGGQTSDNTMCKYPTAALGPKCGLVYQHGVPVADQKAIIKAHNTLRNKVAGGLETQGNPGPQQPAANMRRMEWDDELAKVAQRWMNQCTYAHDKCRDVERFQVGQNAALAYTSYLDKDGVANWPKIVNAWYSEVKDFNREGISNFTFAMNTGHYTQLAWAKTYKVGCGYIYSNSPAPAVPGQPYQGIYACNYGPAGNFGDVDMYIAGEPSGKTCFEGVKCIVGKLCAEDCTNSF